MCRWEAVEHSVFSRGGYSLMCFVFNKQPSSTVGTGVDTNAFPLPDLTATLTLCTLQQEKLRPSSQSKCDLKHRFSQSSVLSSQPQYANACICCHKPGEILGPTLVRAQFIFPSRLGEIKYLL